MEIIGRGSDGRSPLPGKSGDLIPSRSLIQKREKHHKPASEVKSQLAQAHRAGIGCHSGACANRNRHAVHDLRF